MSNWLFGVDLADQPGLGDVVVVAVDGDRALRCLEGDTVGRLVDGVDAEGLRLLDHALVEVQRGVGRFHRVRRRAVGAVLRLERLDEGGVHRAVDALEVVPSGVLAREVHPHGRRLLLGDRHRDDRRVVRAQAGLVVGLDEADVRRAVDRVEHEVGLRRRDLGDLGRPVVTVERDVLLADDLDAELLRVLLDDLVRGTGEDVVGAGEEQRLHALRRQEVHGREDLLVGGGAGVVDVLRSLEALVLHRVEEKSLVAFDDREHRLAGRRGPTPEDGRHLVLGEQLVDLLGEDRRLALAVLLDELDLLVQDPAGGVDLLGGEHERVADRLLADGHHPRRRVQEPELDGVAVDAGGRVTAGTRLLVIPAAPAGRRTDSEERKEREQRT